MCICLFFAHCSGKSYPQRNDSTRHTHRSHSPRPGNAPTGDKPRRQCSGATAAGVLAPGEAPPGAVFQRCAGTAVIAKPGKRQGTEQVARQRAKTGTRNVYVNEFFHYVINSPFVPVLSPSCPRFVPGTSCPANPHESSVLGICPRVPVTFAIQEPERIAAAEKKEPCGPLVWCWLRCSGGAPWHRHHVARLAAVEVVRPPLHEALAVLHVGAAVVGRPYLVLLFVG